MIFTEKAVKATSVQLKENICLIGTLSLTSRNKML